MTPEQRAGVEARHRRYPGHDDRGYCIHDDWPWDDCDSQLLLAALAEAEQRAEAAADQASMQAEVTILEAQRAEAAEQREAALVTSVSELVMATDTFLRPDQRAIVERARALLADPEPEGREEAGPRADALMILRQAIETEWYNGNMDESARDRLLGIGW